ncbi:MAG: cupin domain-containing protein [Gaiellales bacterium]
MPDPPAEEPSSQLEAVDLSAGDGAGPLWGIASEDLNATLLAWPPGAGVAEHVNEERDVLVVVLAGTGTLTVDGVSVAVAAPAACVIPKGTRRAFHAGETGIRYLTAHLRRPGLQLGRFGAGPATT